MDLVLQVKLLLMAKALIEVAAVALIGQGMVALFAGVNREKNIIYVIFRVITMPAVKLARLLTPRKYIRESHLPLAAFFLCFWLWITVVLTIAHACSGAGLTVAQCTGKSG